MFVALTMVPALLIGAGLWYLASLAPTCSTREQARLPSPDLVFDLVVFSRDCGATTGATTQAALLPHGGALEEDSASFLAIGTAADLQPQWDAAGTIALSLPEGATRYRQDASVAGVSIRYR